jgi:hypothetical protein
MKNSLSKKLKEHTVNNYDNFLKLNNSIDIFKKKINKNKNK